MPLRSWSRRPSWAYGSFSNLSCYVYSDFALPLGYSVIGLWVDSSQSGRSSASVVPKNDTSNCRLADNCYSPSIVSFSSAMMTLSGFVANTQDTVKESRKIQCIRSYTNTLGDHPKTEATNLVKKRRRQLVATAFMRLASSIEPLYFTVQVSCISSLLPGIATEHLQLSGYAWCRLEG